MHRSTAGHNPYNLFIVTKDYSQNVTTSLLLTIVHMAMLVVKSIVIHINGRGMDLSIKWSSFIVFFRRSRLSSLLIYISV